ncbi:MAG: hypothetical protein ACI4VV_06775 [Eggerthellaceae bacterium]
MANIAAIGKGLKTTAEIIEAVTKVVGAAGTLKGAVQPAVESDEGKVVVEMAHTAFGDITKRAADAKASIGQVAGKAVSAKTARDEAKRAKKEEKELTKQLKQARQVVLESASQKVTYKEFSKRREEDGAAATALAAGLYSGRGCFVIATYASLDFDNDLTDYRYVYVGMGENLGDAIELACSRKGDPDVYADVKYKQNVHIYVFPCGEADVEEKYSALTSLFLQSLE